MHAYHAAIADILLVQGREPLAEPNREIIEHGVGVGVDRLPVFIRHPAFLRLPGLLYLRDEAAVELAEESRAQLFFLAAHFVELVRLLHEAFLLGDFPQFCPVPYAHPQPCPEQQDRAAGQYRPVCEAFAELFLPLEGGVPGFEVLVLPQFADVEHIGAVYVVFERIPEAAIIFQRFEAFLRLPQPFVGFRGVERPQRPCGEVGCVGAHHPRTVD